MDQEFKVIIATQQDLGQPGLLSKNQNEVSVTSQRWRVLGGPATPAALFLSLGLVMFPLLGRTLPYFCLVYSAVVTLRRSSLSA